MPTTIEEGTGLQPEVMEARPWRLPRFAVGIVVGLVAGFVIGSLTAAFIVARLRPQGFVIPQQGWTTYDNRQG